VQTERDRLREATISRRAFLAPERRPVEARQTGGGAREEEEVIRVGGEGQVVAARRARGDEGGRCLCPLWPQMLPNLGRFGEKWAVRGEDTGLGAALGAVFGPAMLVWTKRDRWGGFGASVGDALTLTLYRK
jgi:hypothetical protein